MGRYQQPSSTWLRMHRGSGPEPKKKHRTWLGAWWHLHRHRQLLRHSADIVSIYPCWFTDENTWGRRHWHIGRRPLPPVPGQHQRPGTLYIGVFAMGRGKDFEVRLLDVRPARVVATGPTAEKALLAYMDTLKNFY